jgi:3-oxoadipate enol-lactonase
VSTRLAHSLRGGLRGPVLLLIHPLGADRAFWDDFVEEIGDRAATLAIDLPGAGESPGPGHPVGLAEQADAIEALRNELGVGQFVIVACAVGTMTAGVYAADHPDSVAAMILTNPTPASAPSAAGMLAARAEAVRAGGMAAVLPGAVERAFLNQPQDARYDRYMNRFAAQHPEAYADALLAASRADATAAFERLRCPILLVAGRHDVLLPVGRAEALAALAPHATLCVYEDAAHFVPYQQPRQFAELVLDFMRRVLPDGDSGE